jgi:hypothetical protein
MVSGRKLFRIHEQFVALEFYPDTLTPLSGLEKTVVTGTNIAFNEIPDH